MEADWSVEIGPGLPSIDASWEGFVDLRASPQTIDTLLEVAQHPPLREALLALNSQDSPWFTTKCDTWPLAADKIDLYEFAARQEEAQAGIASYIDILARDTERFSSFAFQEQMMRQLTAQLRMRNLPQGRVDLVLRAADWKEQNGYGVTLYAAGCGATEARAYGVWQTVLSVAVAATIAAAAHPPRAGE
jgi:hypothetical protein